MPTVGAVEQKILQLEGFDVQFLSSEGANIRGDKQILAQYPGYLRRSADSSTVEEWKRTRFRPAFAGFDVRVIDGKGQPVNGRTLLGTVRATY
jgi:hypothetical protein